jgi:DNA repair protein RecO (recombination protein O)
MSANRINLQPAYVLHHYTYRDSSWVLETLTRRYGRIPVVARGVRRPSSKLRGILQPFQALLISWFGRGELATLSGAEAAAAPLQLAGAALLSGFYLNELIIKLLPRADPHPRLFDDYSAALGALASDAASPAPILRVFEKRLLQHLGYGLVLNREAGGETPIVPCYTYRYILEEGPRLAEEDDRAGVAVQGATLIALDREVFDSAASLKDARRLLGATLDLYLGGRPLKTRHVLREMNARSKTKCASINYTSSADERR